MAIKTLLIRADANANIGVGHVMRCAALAQAWQTSGGKAVFALAEGATELRDRLRSWDLEVAGIDAEPGSDQDAALTQQLCGGYSAFWLCVDGYHFSAHYHQLVNRGIRLLLMDDDGEYPHYHCDMVLNTNPQASPALYNLRGNRPHLLLGTRYALLRREFLPFKRRRAGVSDSARRILITFGGADPHNVTLTALQALQQLRELHLDLTVVLGAANPHRESIELAATAQPHTARVLWNVENMPELISQSDLAISAGGGTCFELAFMQVPMFLITTAQNQKPTVEAFGEANAAIAGGWFHALTHSYLAAAWRSLIGDRRLRENLIKNASQMVDGCGAERVVEAMCTMEESQDRK